MKIVKKKFAICVSLVATAVAGLSLLAAEPARAQEQQASTITCEDESGDVTWSVKIEVRATQNGKEIDRDPSADITTWKLGCLKHKDVKHHKDTDEVQTGVCLNGDACEASRNEEAQILTPGSFHCHVIGGSIICHEY
jgi:hypothetical protein